MAAPRTRQKFDAASYLQWEATQSEKHEYLAGEIFAIVGVRQSHNVAALNLASALRTRLAGSNCRVFISDVKARIGPSDAFFYPDVVASCDARDRATPEYVSYPSLIVEVLSASTAAFDRGAKFGAYRRLDSLKEYALVDIEAQRVELFRRDASNHWVLHEFAPGDEVEFASVGVSIAVDAILADTEEPPAGEDGS